MEEVSDVVTIASKEVESVRMSAFDCLSYVNNPRYTVPDLFSPNKERRRVHA
jgi:hypothetical protein